MYSKPINHAWAVSFKTSHTHELVYLLTISSPAKRLFNAYANPSTTTTYVEPMFTFSHSGYYEAVLFKLEQLPCSPTDFNGVQSMQQCTFFVPAHNAGFSSHSSVHCTESIAMPPDMIWGAIKYTWHLKWDLFPPEWSHTKLCGLPCSNVSKALS